MVFSKNITPAAQTKIMALWANGTLQQYEKYLGLPPIVGRAKRKALSNIKERVWSKLQTWKEKSLSQGGKEIILKAMALAIPTYAMSCFQLPTSLCDDLERIMARFWWGQNRNERRIHWVRLDKRCESKFFGGLGFKDLKLFSQALLAKQGRRILQNESSLLHKI